MTAVLYPQRAPAHPHPQAPSAVVLVRPHHFGVNPQTAADNAFQANGAHVTARSPERAAYAASSRLAERLERAGVTVHRFEDEGRAHPDSVFCNNWFSTHEDGRVVLYSMHAANRRGERRTDIIDLLAERYHVTEVVDLSSAEQQQRALEGTGALVLDHIHRVMYVARSRRADPGLVAEAAAFLGYRLHTFDARDARSTPVFHTNVMLSVATEFALAGLSMVADPAERATLQTDLEASGRTVIKLTAAQVGDFAANAIELQGRSGRLLALSTRAAASLTRRQRRVIERSCELVAVDVAAIEWGGGSVRCMIAGVHLEPRRADLGVDRVEGETRTLKGGPGSF